MRPRPIKLKETIITPSDDSWLCALITTITHNSHQRRDICKHESRDSLEPIYNREQQDTTVLLTFICMRCMGNNCIRNLRWCCLCVWCEPLKKNEFSPSTCVCRRVLFGTSTQQASVWCTAQCCSVWLPDIMRFEQCGEINAIQSPAWKFFN